MPAQKSIASPVPPRLLRNLLGKSVAPKIKVLDVGCGDGSVVRALRQLGADAVGIDDTLQAPAEGLTAGSLAANFAYPAHSFDVVIVRGMKVYGGPFEGPEVFTSTANLLSCLRPAGRLVLFEPQDVAGPGAVDAGRLNLWREHLARFPGTCEVRQFRDGLGFLLSLQWLLGAKRINATVVSMTIPTRSVSRLEWHRIVRDILIGKPKRGAA